MSGAPSVIVIWDYDTAIGQVNATYPYNFHEEVLLEEIANVDRLLEFAAARGVRMTFACVGFAAEPGHFPYHVPEQLRRIHAAGHEIASHSWRHEWFPALAREQVKRSLARSKLALESCIGAPGAVTGFVPPFSRPMTWYRKGSISLGDRSLDPFRSGANIGSLCCAAADAGYTWCRVSYHAWSQRVGLSRWRPLIGERAERAAGVACIPLHYAGFDQPAHDLLDLALAQRRSMVLAGHPSRITSGKEEDLSHLASLLDRIAELQQRGLIHLRTMSGHLQQEEVAAR